MTQSRFLFFFRAGLLGAVLLLQLPGALASPPADEDAVARFLGTEGLLEAQGSDEEHPEKRNLLQQMRHTASDMVRHAMGLLGVPYSRGGQSADEGFDCSGFTRHVFERSLGLLLPRRADDQARAPGLVPVQREELRPGDLVFFNTLRRTFSHVGIYIGEGKFIHSPRTGSRVRVESLRNSYWTKRYTGARRAGSITESASLTSPLPEGGDMAGQQSGASQVH